MRKIDVFELDLPDIEVLLDAIATGGESVITGFGIIGYGVIYNITNIYSVGATLCIDIRPTNEDLSEKFADVITITHNGETYGLLTGGMRRLLSIKALKSLEKILKDNNIKHTQKWLY
jgi:hypothetical protein